eukprot:gnl/MRDRNA2_/MRDRNA2_90485_c0_seq1.p1 gnl/MRDRNA2_/MRDRNA2_90485_c0~~gnl/MRDRNA2_/MRDRNA2_90485_c0_seq1.p1  ORF type:complete len:353 (+),score=44.88 gnl/MRDRNA2_/MRDRNA2_90485_c0_seq1:84-1142(+)
MWQCSNCKSSPVMSMRVLLCMALEVHSLLTSSVANREMIAGDPMHAHRTFLDSHKPTAYPYTIQSREGGIPKILHRFWFTPKNGVKQCHPVFVKCREMLERNNPGWEEWIWEDDDMQKLLASQKAKVTFEKAGLSVDTLSSVYWQANWIEKTDIAREIIMHIYGGLYMDHDVCCDHSMNRLLQGNITLRNYGKTNFLAAVPEHTFFVKVLQSIIRTYKTHLLSSEPNEAAADRMRPDWRTQQGWEKVPTIRKTGEYQIRTIMQKMWGTIYAYSGHSALKNGTQIVSSNDVLDGGWNAERGDVCTHRRANTWAPEYYDHPHPTDAMQKEMKKCEHKLLQGTVHGDELSRKAYV